MTRPLVPLLLGLAWTTLAVTLAIVPSPAQAQTQAKKLYRWVAKDGSVYFSDQVPPDQNNLAREEKSAKSGLTTQRVEAAQTLEEKAALEQAQARAAAQALIDAEQARKIQAMVTYYATEKDLLAAFNEREVQLKNTVRSTEASIVELNRSLKVFLETMSTLEMNGQKGSPQQRAQIPALNKERQVQRVALVQHQDALVALAAERATAVAAYRAAHAPVENASAAAPAAVPPAR